jgi:hypothetical protein
MTDATGQEPVSIETLVAAIACSPIVMAQPVARLPAGFDDMDMAILDWIAAEGRRIGCGSARM